MKQSSKRLWSLLIAFLFVLAAFLCFFDLVQPEYQSVETLRSQQLGEANYLVAQTALVKQAQTVLNTYQNESQNTSNISLAMPSGQDIAGALAQIQGIAVNSGIAVVNIGVTAPELQVKTANASSTAMKPIGSFTFNVSATGSYESFKNFLSELETNIRVFDVKSVSFQPITTVAAVAGKPTAGRDIFSYNVTVATYYQPQ